MKSDATPHVPPTENKSWRPGQERDQPRTVHVAQMEQEEETYYDASPCLPSRETIARILR